MVTHFRIVQTTSPPTRRGVLYSPACYVKPNVEEGSTETENLARIHFCEKITSIPWKTEKSISPRERVMMGKRERQVPPRVVLLKGS